MNQAPKDPDETGMKTQVNQSKPEGNPQAVSNEQLRTPWSTFLGWLDTHGPRIQSISTIVQAVIAVLMLLSLIFGYLALRESHAALLVGQHQLETTIEPRLDIFYEGTGWPSLPTNGAVVKLKNVGAVPISNLEIVVKMQITFDKDFEIKGFTRGYGKDQISLLTNSLPPSGTFVYDFERENELHELLIGPPPGSDLHAACFVIKYRRSFDMKPTCRLIMFFAMHSGFDIGRKPVAWPVDALGWQTTEKSSDKGTSVFMQPREKVRELLMRWEIPTSVGED